MQSTIIVLLLLLIVLCLFYLSKYRKVTKNLEQQRLEIETEELRMFDFLHTLGETLTEEGEPIQGLYIEQSSGVRQWSWKLMVQHCI